MIDVINGHSPSDIENALRKQSSKPHFIFENSKRQRH